MYKFFILTLILLTNIGLFAQTYSHGYPLIKNITPKEYGYESQNFSIIQDSRGVLYVGNLNGILEFVGKSWELINLKCVPRLSLGKDSLVYVGG